MKKNYIYPQVEIAEVVVESGIATSPNVEDPGKDPETDW